MNETKVLELIQVIENLLPYVVTQVVACNGLKCREGVCESCSFDAEETAEKAEKAYMEAVRLIKRVNEGEGIG